MQSETKPALTIYLAEPRGFCAGVDRAIQIVELALAKYGAPVYVRHEIVHNKYVVDDLRAKGAVFVEELAEIPETEAPVIFSAHGVEKAVPEEAARRNFFYIDATCPLVSKVHIEAERLYKNGYKIILIGHAGHPEVIGTMGQLPKGAVTLIETVSDVDHLDYAAEEKISYITQTTLSVDDTLKIVKCLTAKYPNIKAPDKQDICYATTNRQEAVKSIASKCDCLLVVGAPNSSNSRRLVEVAERAGAKTAYLVQTANEIPWDKLHEISVLGITAGASAPEILVDQIIAAFKQRFDTSIENITTARENVSFKIPRQLTNAV